MAELALRWASGGDDVPLIVRCRTINYDKPPEWAERNQYGMAADRREAILQAFDGSIHGWFQQQLLGELLGDADVAAASTVIAKRGCGQYGYLELTIIEARGELAARYLAVSRLPECERDVYIDALIDDHLANCGEVRETTIHEIQRPLPGVWAAVAPAAPADVARA